MLLLVSRFFSGFRLIVLLSIFLVRWWWLMLCGRLVNLCVMIFLISVVVFLCSFLLFMLCIFIWCRFIWCISDWCMWVCYFSMFGGVIMVDGIFVGVGVVVGGGVDVGFVFGVLEVCVVICMLVLIGLVSMCSW